MGKRILLPVDESDQSHTAVEFAAENHPDATLVLFHVINPAEAGYSAGASVPTFPEEWFEDRRETAETLFDELEGSIEGIGSNDVERVTEVGPPTDTIVEYAADHDVDQIVMGSHGRGGVSRILLGSVAETVVRRATVPVTVVR